MLRGEVGAGHVVEQAAEHLSGDGAVLEVGAEVDAADKELSGGDFGLEDDAEAAVGGPVVDYLDDWAEFRREVVEDHESRLSDEVPPLPVGVGFGWKRGQRGVGRVAENSEGMRGLPACPGGVPED